MALRDQLDKPDLGREEMFALYERAVRERFSLTQIGFDSPDQLKIETSDNRTFTIHLENLWRECRGATEPRIDVVERHLSALAGVMEPQKQLPATKVNIVPTIKDNEYLHFLGEKPSVVHEHLVGDIWVVYAVDLPTAIQSLGALELQRLNISSIELRGLAVDNLRRVLPEIQQHGGGPWYMLTAGGDYTASLLLLDSIWDQLAESVEGDIVAAVPSRDVLLFTGSDSSDGIQAVRQKAREIHEGGDHVISQTLLRRTSGRWQIFE
jgi:uncharacterized protein YtpQ (UPF0354 family)